jgi:hypothetical protein
LTREEFLVNPLELFYSRTNEIPPEWIRAAWETDDDFHRELHYLISRELRKNGELKGVRGLAVILAQSLTPEQVVELYISLGGKGTHPRLLEWREQFEEYFARDAHLLPTIPEEITLKLYPLYLAGAIKYDRSDWAKAKIRDLLRRGGDINRLYRLIGIEPTSEFGEYEVVPPTESGGISVLELARHWGRLRIIELLLEAGAQE